MKQSIHDLKTVIIVFSICAGVMGALLLLNDQMQTYGLRFSNLFFQNGDNQEVRVLKNFLAIFIIIASLSILSFLLLFVHNKQAEQKSGMERGLLEKALDGIDSGVLIVDEKDRYFYNNKKSVELLGTEKLKALKGQFYSMIQSHIQVALSENIPLTIEEKFVLESGDIKPLDVTISPFQNMFGNIKNVPEKMVIILIKDITNRHQADEEIQSLKHQFYQAQKMEALGRMAGGMAHDFNNILGAIIGNAEFLEQDLDPQSKNQKHAGKIMSAALEAREVIASILAFSRHQDIDLGLVNAREIIDDIRPIIEGMLKDKSYLEWTITKDALNVFGNATHIKQALTNLCSNAIDAVETAPKNHNHNVKIVLDNFNMTHPIYSYISAHQIHGSDMINYHSLNETHHRALLGYLDAGCDYLMFTVSDTGEGISRHIVEHIFEPFFTTKDIHKGTGLGLSATQGMVINHGGVLVMDTVIGQGTDFHIILPQNKQDIIHDKTDKVPKDKTINSFASNLTTVVIDDHGTMLDIADKMLQRLGHKTRCFLNPKDAQKFIKDNAGDIGVIVTDYNMPGLNGIDLVRDLEKTGIDIPVVIMTGFMKKILNSDELMPNLVCSVIQKPIKMDGLKEALSFYNNTH